MFVAKAIAGAIAAGASAALTAMAEGANAVGIALAGLASAAGAFGVVYVAPRNAGTGTTVVNK